MTDRELMQQALDALDAGIKISPNSELHERLRTRLSCPDADPVAWVSENIIPFRGGTDNHYCTLTPFKCASNTVPLYTAHTIRKWEGLTFEDRNYLRKRFLNDDKFGDISFYISLVEEKLKEKNG